MMPRLYSDEVWEGCAGPPTARSCRDHPEGCGQAHYVKVESRSGPGQYQVWIGDAASPAHCSCEHFRWMRREPGVLAYCMHISEALGMGASL